MPLLKKRSQKYGKTQKGQSMNWQMKQIRLGCAGVFALIVAGCGTSQTVSASRDKLSLSARQVVGTSLIGARGKTQADQNKIDETAAGLCSANVWSKSECLRHGRGSNQ